MRILFLSRCYYPAVDYGGPIFKMKSMADLLTQHGHQVTVWTTDILNLTEKMPGAPFEREMDGARVIYHRSGRGYRWDRFIPGFGAFCEQNLRDFDVMHVFGYRDFISPTACGVAVKRGIPYVVEPLGSFLPHLRSIKKKWLYDNTLGKPIVRNAKYLIATAESEKEDILRMGVPEEKVVVRFNGLNLEGFDDLPPRGALRVRLGLPPDAFLVLFLSRINPKKGLERLLESLQQLPDRVQVVIAGPAEEESYLAGLKARAKQLGVESRAHFVGPLYDAEKMEAFADADLFVLPSNRENYGNAAAEAAACGIPTIVTDTCGIAPILDGRAGVVIPTEVEPLTRAIQSLMDDPVRCAALAAGGRGLRNELGWAGPIRVQEGIYERVAGHSTPAV